MEAIRIVRAELRRLSGSTSGNGVLTSRGRWQERYGLLLELIDEDGRRGVGEASPLPGFSPDSEISCAAALSDLALPFSVQLDTGSPLESVGVALARVESSCPAAVFAFETALLDLVGQALRRPVWWILGGRSPRDVPVNSLLPTEREVAVAAAVSAVERGFGTLKMKVGAADRCAEELETVAAVRQAVGERVRIRLDANRAWAPEVAWARLDELSRYLPELIEEPVIGGCVDELGRRSPVRLALDETLGDVGSFERVEELLAAGWVSVLVLKPTVLGGALRCLQWARLARDFGAQVVVTHCLDGPVAMAAAMELALALAPKLACGLDRHPLQDAWPPVILPRLAGANVVATEAVGLGFPDGAFGRNR